nr:dTDP-glucose 4,6-dehydratase-like [Nerophis lumbriciformis]
MDNPNQPSDPTSLNPTILITGGAGFIGSNFVRLALERTEDRIVVFDKLTYAGSLSSLRDVADDRRFRFVEGDIADRAAVRALYTEERPRWTVNFAAESHVDRSIDAPGEFIETNIVGTFEMLEGARQLHDQLTEAERGRLRFLHVSTDEVYGSLGAKGLFREDTPYDPSSPYSASKAAADHLANAYHHTYGLPVIVTNCSNNYGPYQFPEKLIPVMILNALDGQALPIYGNGKNVRDWIYVGDHCAGVLDALESGQPGEKYNLGGGNERTNLQVVDTICEILDELHPPTANPRVRGSGLGSYSKLKTFVDDRPGHDWRYAIDARKARKELGWKAQHDFSSGLRETVRWPPKGDTAVDFQQTDLPGVILVKPDVHGDERGFFLETYHRDKYAKGGIGERFVQDNHSKSSHGILRGLHAQQKKPQGKLVRAVEGEIFDVAADMRQGSPTFGKWVGEVLSAEDFHQLYVPPGFLHGFCVLSETAQVEYKCTALYDPADEVAVIWNDPDLAIDWPIEEPRLSTKDAAAPRLAEITDRLPSYSGD